MLKYILPILVLASMAMGSSVVNVDPKDPVQCTLCKTVFTEIVNLLKTNTSQAVIIKNLEQMLCNSTGTMNGECKVLIDTFGPLILKYLSSGIDPAKVCQIFGLCPQASAIKVELKADPPLCTLCEFVVTYADNLLQKNQTEQQIVKSLELVCNLAPGSLKTQCTALVEQFGPTIVELLIKFGNDSKKICQEIKICPAEQLKQQQQQQQQVKADPPLCTLCQFVVQYADTLLKNNASEAQIVKAMEGVCNLAPSSLKDECKAFVDQYATLIIGLLVQLADPKTVCEKIKVCPTSQQIVAKIESQVRADPPLCTLCQFVVQYADTLLKNNATEAQIVKAMEGVCNLAPGSLKTECTALVDQFGPMIVQLLVQFGNDPKKICEAIKICPAKVLY